MLAPVFGLPEVCLTGIARFMFMVGLVVSDDGLALQRGALGEDALPTPVGVAPFDPRDDVHAKLAAGGPGVPQGGWTPLEEVASVRARLACGVLGACGRLQLNGPSGQGRDEGDS